MKHFLDLTHLDAGALRAIIARARALKEAHKKREFPPLLAGYKLAMIFEKNSTRTRVSFEVGMAELGGHALFLSGREMQMGRGETIADTARVLSRYVDMIMLRCHSHEMLLELAQYATVPVINGLTDFSHPCQIMADIMTYEELRGSIRGRKVAWVGDGNNVCTSFIEAAQRFEFSLSIACPQELEPEARIMDWARGQGANVTLATTPLQAVQDADLVVTDTWVSMGDLDADHRKSLLTPYQVNAALMARASQDALFMHCLPAHRGEEVTSDIIDGMQSAVWDEAENRLHVQKAIMLWCLEK